MIHLSLGSNLTLCMLRNLGRSSLLQTCARVFACVALVGVHSVNADPTWEVFQLTSGSALDLAPVVEGTTYVWQRAQSGAAKIMMWSEGDASPVRISDTQKEHLPRIDGGRVIWYSDASGNDFEVILWENGVAAPLTDNTVNDRHPDIGGFATVWRSEGYLLYDDGIEQVQITQAATAEYPRVMDDWIVFEAGSPYKNVFLWNDGVLTKMTDNTHADIRPETDGQTIVWYTSNESFKESGIMRWTTGEGAVRLTPTDTSCVQPDVSGDIIVYAVHDGTDYEIVFRYYGVEYQITDNNYDDLEPAVDGDRIVWEGSDNGGRHIFYAKLSNLTGGEIPGACCVDLECSSIIPTDCSALGGEYLGAEVLCTLDSCGTEPAAGWSTYQHDPQRTGRSTATIPSFPERVWSLNIGGGNVSPVIGPDGTIYVAGQDDILVAANPDGTARWFTHLGQMVMAPASVRRDGYLFTSRQSTYGKIDYIDGGGLCGKPYGMAAATALDPTGNCYVASWTDVIKLDPSCNVLWTFDGAHSLSSHVALGQDGSVYASTDDSAFSIIKLDPSDGTETWSFNTPGKTGEPAIGADGTIYTLSFPDTVFAINPDGTEQWRTVLADQNNAQQAPSPAIGSDGTLYFSSKTQVGGYQSLVALSPDGLELWRFIEAVPSGADPISPVVDNNGIILFPIGLGDLVAISPIDGTELWRVGEATFGGIICSPAIGPNGTIYVVTDGGYLSAYEEGCPAPLPEDTPFAYRKVAQEGDLINGVEVGEITAFELRDNGLVTFATGNSPMTVFIERLDSGFDIIARGTFLGVHEIDAPKLPHEDASGNRYMTSYVVDTGNAIFVNDTLFVAERSIGAPQIQLHSIDNTHFIDHNDVGAFLVIGKELSTDASTLYSVDTTTNLLTPLLTEYEVIDGFQVDILNPAIANGYGNDGIAVLQAFNGQYAIVTPSTVLVQTGDSIDGYPISSPHSPRRTQDGTVCFLDEGHVYCKDKSSAATHILGPGDSIHGLPVDYVDSYAINNVNDLAVRARLLAGDSVYMNDKPVAIAGLTTINGLQVDQISRLTFGDVSMNDNREVAFVAQRSGEPEALYVATLLTFDLDNDGDVDNDDVDQVFGCFDVVGELSCDCLANADSNTDGLVDCDDWNECKRTWTGPPQFPPLLPVCDSDCNFNLVADDLELEAGVSTDCNFNSTPDDCDITSGYSLDTDANQVPDECECLVASAPLTDTVGPKNRYLSLNLQDEGTIQAIRITFVDLPVPYDSLNGLSMWVSTPVEVSENSGAIEPIPGFASFIASSLQCDPFLTDWTQYDSVFITHEYVVPGGTYHVQVMNSDCSPTMETTFSQPLELISARWGDVCGEYDSGSGVWTAPNGVVGVPTDIVALLEKFRNLPNAPIKARTDIEPLTADFIVNISDVMRALDAFRGFSYPFTPVALPCQ